MAKHLYSVLKNWFVRNIASKFWKLFRHCRFAIVKILFPIHSLSKPLWCTYIDFVAGSITFWLLLHFKSGKIFIEYLTWTLTNLLSHSMVNNVRNECTVKDKLEGYGRITWKKPNTGGHYFWDLIVANPVSIHHILRYQMKDKFIIFQMIAHSLILTE